MADPGPVPLIPVIPHWCVNIVDDVIYLHRESVRHGLLYSSQTQGEVYRVAVETLLMVWRDQLRCRVYIR